MKITFFLYFFIFFIFLNCSESKLKTSDLVAGNSVWVLSSKNNLDTANSKQMKLRFKENGYAYEENTILRFPYKFHLLSNVFEINHHEYKIVSSSENKMLMIHTKTGAEISLEKE